MGSARLTTNEENQRCAQNCPDSESRVRVVDLASAPGEFTAWGKPRPFVYLWGIVELLLITNPWQISSTLRVWALRKFGAEIGANVIFRPRTRVKFPWKLTVGAGSWIGEGVWFHNQDHIRVGHNVVISQETFLTTGSHAMRTDMGLITRPIRIDDGAWVTSRCVVLGGAKIGKSAVVTPGTVVKSNEVIQPGDVFGSPPAQVIGTRFGTGNSEDS